MAAQSNMEELKSMVTQSLHASGVLGKYKAQMRASVFDILNGKERKEIYMENKKVQNIAKTNFGIVTQIALILQGALLTELVREYLQFYDLDYSLSVLVPEANLSDLPKSRENIIKDVSKYGEFTSNEPILLQLLQCLKPKEDKKQPQQQETKTSATTLDIPIVKREEKKEEKKQQPLKIADSKPVKKEDESNNSLLITKPNLVDDLSKKKPAETKPATSKFSYDFDDEDDDEFGLGSVIKMPASQPVFASKVEQKKEEPAVESLLSEKTLGKNLFMQEIKKQSSFEDQDKKKLLAPVVAPKPVAVKDNSMLDPDESFSALTSVDDLPSPKDTKHNNSMDNEFAVEDEWEEKIFADEHADITEQFSEDFEHNDYSDHTANSNERFDHVEPLDDDNDSF